MERIERADLVDLIHSLSKSIDVGIGNVESMDADFYRGYHYWTCISVDGVRIMVRCVRPGIYMAELS